MYIASVMSHTFSQPLHLILFLLDCLWVECDFVAVLMMRSRIGPLIVSPTTSPISIGLPLCRISIRPLRIKSNAIVLVSCICIECDMCKNKTTSAFDLQILHRNGRNTYMLPPRVSIKQWTWNLAWSARFLNSSGSQHINHSSFNDTPKTLCLWLSCMTSILHNVDQQW